MIEGLQVILEWLSAYGNSLLDNKRGLNRAEGVPLDGVRRVGDFHVVVVLELA